MADLVVLPIILGMLLGGEPPASDTEQTASAERVVAAHVDGTPVYAHDVERRIERVLGGRKIAPEARPVLQAETLSQLVDRRLILRFLERHDLAASEQDLDAELARIERQLAPQDLTLDEYLKSTAQTREDLKESLRWELSWGRYLERNLSEQNLQSFFERRRREFDGTQLRTAHILLKPTAEEDPAALAQTIEEAEEIRAAIVAGQITFAEAAKKHSVSPTAENGGDIGWIGRRGPMPEPFSAAAFALKEGEVSQPVVTPFGVHLIQVLEVKPGDKTWQDVRRELAQAVTRYLFTWAADQQRPYSQVEYTGATPYFKPGTRELVE